jgi:L-threonylcarbamoyladenylate synthase
MLNRIKGRVDKPYIILIGEKCGLKEFSEGVSPAVQSLIDSCWPGPLTLILRAKAGLPKIMRGVDGSIALRMPKHEGLLALLASIPALFSTNANKAGMPVPLYIEDIDQEILREVNFLVVDILGGQVSLGAKPSTILDCTGLQPRVIRVGAYAIGLLEEIAGQKFLVA